MANKTIKDVDAIKTISKLGTIIRGIYTQAEYTHDDVTTETFDTYDENGNPSIYVQSTHRKLFLISYKISGVWEAQPLYIKNLRKAKEYIREHDLKIIKGLQYKWNPDLNEYEHFYNK